MRTVTLATLSGALLSVPFWTGGAHAQPAPSEAGQLVGEGQLTDGEGHEGTWHVAAAAHGNNLAGTLIVNLAGRVLTLDLAQANSYRENGRCYVRGESGRDRVELAGPCDAKPFAGSVRGFLDGSGTFSGQFTGTLMPGGARPAPTAAPAATMVRAAPANPSRATAPIATRAVAVNANSGPFTGSGALTTHDGETGQWTARGTLVAGQIAGQLAVSVGSRQMTVDLGQGRAYFEHGVCVLKGVAGRNRFQLRGRCDQTPFTGTVNGYFDGVGEVNGEFTGSLVWGKPAAASAAGAVLPTGKLTCGYLERVGGVVAGDLGTREFRPSALGSLTLTPAGAYIARNGSGRFVREGASSIRLTSGPWAGAKATLQPDNSGAPAVYFELDDNRRADGTYIVDPWRTFCTAGGAR